MALQDYNILGQYVTPSGTFNPTPTIGASDPSAAYLQQGSTGGATGYIGSTGSLVGAGDTNSGGLLSNLGGLDGIKLGIQGIGTIASIWNAFQAQKLAKDTFEYNKNVTDTNLANSIQSYNTTLEDRIRARTKVEGGTDASAEQYIAKNRLARQA